MNGITRVLRTWVILAICARNRKQIAVMMMLETTMIHTKEKVSERWPPLASGVSICGPGTRP